MNGTIKKRSENMTLENVNVVKSVFAKYHEGIFVYMRQNLTF